MYILRTRLYIRVITGYSFIRSLPTRDVSLPTYLPAHTYLYVRTYTFVRVGIARKELAISRNWVTYSALKMLIIISDNERSVAIINNDSCIYSIRVSSSLSVAYYFLLTILPVRRSLLPQLLVTSALTVIHSYRPSGIHLSLLDARKM